MSRLIPEPIDLRATAFSDDLDMMRGMAALAVFFCHFWDLFYVGASPAGSHNPWVQLFGSHQPWLQVLYFLGGFGRDAVMVFFVLSGLLIGNSTLRALALDRWSWKDYLANRFSRLYVVLIPALLLGTFWDSLGSILPSTSAVYHHGCPEVAHFFEAATVNQLLSIKTFLGNLGFLQGIFVPTFGSNIPLWSLSFEFWYYLLFPCLLLTFWGSGSRSKKLFYLIAAMTMFLLVGRDIGFYMLAWLMGAALNLRFLYWQTSGRKVRRMLVVAGGIVFMGALGMSRIHLWEWLFPKAVAAGFKDMFTAASAAFFLYGLYSLRPASTPGVYRTVARFLSRMSYTLYAVHFPLLFFLRFVMIPSRWSPDWLHLTYGLGVSGGVFFYAFSLSHFTEARTPAIRDGLRNGFGRPPKPAIDRAVMPRAA